MRLPFICDLTGLLRRRLALDLRSNDFPFFEFACEMFPYFFGIEIEERATGGEVLDEHLTYRIGESSRQTRNGNKRT